MVKRQKNGLYKVLVYVSDALVLDSDVIELRIEVPSLHRSEMMDECFARRSELKARGIGLPVFDIEMNNWRLRLHSPK